MSSSKSLREAQAEAVHSRLVDAALGIFEAGEVPTMRAVARAAGVSERTIYRYFATHDDLVAALRPRIAQRAGVPLCDHADGLEDYAARLFATFEENHGLVAALNYTPSAAAHLEASRAQNLRAMRSLLASAHPEAEASAVDAAAMTLRLLLSGAGWLYLRSAGESDGQALVAKAAWTIRLVRNTLAQGPDEVASGSVSTDPLARSTP